jgi:hypothetical protein
MLISYVVFNFLSLFLSLLIFLFLYFPIISFFSSFLYFYNLGPLFICAEQSDSEAEGACSVRDLSVIHASGAR